MSVNDESIIAKLPNSEDYLLPDIIIEERDFDEIGNFVKIFFSECNLYIFIIHYTTFDSLLLSFSLSRIESKLIVKSISLRY